jgi:hypothetical protein
MPKRSAGLAAGLVVLVLAPSAVAAPVTVDLRIEGASTTLFEGPVTTDIRTFRFTGESAEHQCDGTTTGSSPAPVPTRGAALMAAAESAPFSVRGTWSDQFGATINEVAGENTAFNPNTGRFLGEFKNGLFAQVGACGDPIAAGDRVLFAYTDGSEPLLALTGPTTARPGATASVKVTDSDGAPVSGASVGGRSTGADGTVVVGPFTQRGDNDLKASKAGTVRSNRLRVCVSDGSDGFCGAGSGGAPGVVPGDRTAPATTLALASGRVFSRRRAPRRLRGTVAADPSGLLAVKLRLTRRVGKKCWYFSGTRERFRRTRCGRGSFFKIGDSAEWSYLLPKRLGKGRYVLEAKAIDRAFNRGAVTRVRFRVR